MGEMMTHGGGMAAGGDLLQVLQSQKVLTAEQAKTVLDAGLDKVLIGYNLYRKNKRAN